MKQIFIGQHPTEAHLVRGLLEADGIAAEVRGESIYAVRGEAPVTPDTLPAVWVSEDDVPRAQAILAGYGRQQAPDAHRASWLCPGCGEGVEPQFTECWHCGATRPED